jgi:hypothetical protein
MFVLDSLSMVLFSSLMLLPGTVPEDNWNLGQDLWGGQSYNYHICDPTLLISDSYCYDIDLKFIDSLRSHNNLMWIVQATINHDGKENYAIFQINANTFEIKTDVSSQPYADSVEKTLFWIQEYASEHDSKMLKTGKSWGDVSQFLTPDTNLMVKGHSDFSFDNNNSFYDVGFSRANLVISQDYPFPVDAQVKRPAPLEKDAFSFTINSVTNENTFVQSDFMSDFSNDSPIEIPLLHEDPQIVSDKSLITDFTNDTDFDIAPFIIPENNTDQTVESIEDGDSKDWVSLFMDIYYSSSNSTNN